MPGPSVPDRPGLTVASAAGRWVIFATVLGSGIAGIDATAVSIAIPSIGRDLHAGWSSLQWIITSYTLTLAGLLLVGGSLGDRYGRRRVFVVGVVGFAGASALCGLAPNTQTLIAARALQGVGGALLLPGSLAILQASFDPGDRARAIGAWSGLGGVATAIGPFLGGWLVEAVSWRLIFFINLPLAIAVVIVAVRHVPESTEPDVSGPVDVTGGALVTFGLVGVVYGLIDGPNSGWGSPRVAVALLAGALLLASFFVLEAHRRDPMLPLGLFSSMQFSSANAVTFVVYAALGGALFLLPIELQEVGGYSVVESGIALLPLTVIMLLLSSRSGALATRIGPRPQMTLGPIGAGIGLALLSRAGEGNGYVLDVLPGVVVLGLGLAANVAPLTSTVLAAAPAEHAGVASAINNDVARTAQLVAVAVLPGLAGIASGTFSDVASFSDGFRSAMFIAAGLCVAGGLLAGATIRDPDRAGRARPAAVEPPPRPRVHCALDAPPLESQESLSTSESPAAGGSEAAASP
jgi:EmrB/QacA subfamily drug resistance transporter